MELPKVSLSDDYACVKGNDGLEYYYGYEYQYILKDNNIEVESTDNWGFVIFDEDKNILYYSEDTREDYLGDTPEETLLKFIVKHISKET